MPTTLEPPGPKGKFLLGNLIDYTRDPVNYALACSREYGDIVPLRLLHLKFYLLNNPDYSEYVLVNHSRDFHKPRLIQLVKPFMGNGLISSEGDFWLSQRRLIQPAFHKDRIAGYAQTMVEYTQKMLKTWDNGQVRDLHEAMMHLSMHIICKTLFNADVNKDAKNLAAAFDGIVKEFGRRVKNPLVLPEKIPTPGNRRFVKAISDLDQALYRIIQERRKNEDDKGDLLSMLLQVHDENNERMSDQQLRDEMVTLFVAGHETTAATLSWAWYLLGQNPQVEAKIVAEIDRVLGGRPPTFADIPQLIYSDMVVKETMRVYPNAAIFGRRAIKDFELGGYKLPAGTEVWLSPYIAQRDPRYFEQPEEFKPERWENDLAKRIPRFAYFPFSAGPRQCIGNSFAQMEILLVLVTILQQFHLKLASNKPLQTEFIGSLRPKSKLEMVLTRRATNV